MNSASSQPLRLLLLGYGNVANAFLPLLASRSEWLLHTFGIQPLISGVGTRRHGFFIHAHGIEPSSLAWEEQPVIAFRNSSAVRTVADASAFIEAGKEAGASSFP